METAPRLERPNARYRESFLAAVHEFRADGSGLGDTKQLDLSALEADFEAHVRSRLRGEDRASLAPGLVPQTEWWLMVGAEYIGRAKVRHELSSHLREFGGHIGYEVRPSKRRCGYGSALLRLALAEAGKLGLKRVLITCDADNLGSRGVIEANGGELEGEFNLSWYDKPIRRYWISLEP